MTMQASRILVFPRSVFGDVFSLLPWDSIQEQIEEIENSFSWVVREEAECSNDWVQAIPCAFIKDLDSKYCVLRRVRNTRNDLNKKLSLIVGGHIDDSPNHETFLSHMSLNLRRELEEEVGIRSIKSPRPVGVIIDDSSVVASRHVAFVHEMQAEEVSPRAPEEFMVRSKFSGMFMELSQLMGKRDEFDPWSKLLIEEYVCRGNVRRQARQRSFL